MVSRAAGGWQIEVTRQKPIETRTPERPEPRLEMLRLVLPEGQGKQAEILGQGPEAAPAVVGVMRDLGVA